MTEMRVYAQQKFKEKFPWRDSENMESRLYEHVQHLLADQGYTGMDFYPFRKTYKKVLTGILSNLKRTDSGLNNMLKGSMEEFEDILLKTPKDWEPEMWAVTVINNDAEETMLEGTFDCGNCARKGMYSKNTTHYEKQTRSADEPMTIFVECKTCGKNYRFSS